MILLVLNSTNPLDFKNSKTVFMDKSFEKRIPQSPKSPMRNKTKKIFEDDSTQKISSPSKYSDRFIPNRIDSPSTNMYTKNEPKVQENQKDKYQELLTELLSPNETILNYETKTQNNSPFFSFTQKPKSILEHSNTRKIHPNPIKVLDAPYLQDDFYLNLIDWGSLNILAVGLSDTVYLWNASTTKVSSLCVLPNETPVTSVSWMNNGKLIAVGTNTGSLEIYDTEKSISIHSYSGHLQRISSLSWNGNIISSGSRDRMILNRDIRSKNDQILTFRGHKQEVCGLKWSPDGKELASGGNDNKLFVWQSSSETPLYKFSDHCAAVKAIAWNPHQHSVLASGGGTADKKLR